jgi:protein SCO1/2
MNQKNAILGIAILAIVVLSVGVYLVQSKSGHFNGTSFDPALAAPDFVLVDQQRASFRLSEQQDKIVVVYFGYTNCPDECPLSMAKMREVFDLLNEEGSNVEVALITTDPVRDTPEVMGDYLKNFNPEFRGLTGDEAVLFQVYQSYGVTVLDDGETHSNRFYVIDKYGKLRMTWAYEMTASEITADLLALSKE